MVRMLLLGFCFPSHSRGLYTFNEQLQSNIKFSTSAARRRRTQNSKRFSRKNSHVTFLDKFTKLTSMDGSLICKAPLNLRCVGSFFDREGKVDTARNFNVGQQRHEQNKLERISRQEAAELEEDERGEAKEEWTSEEDSDHISIFRSATDMENRILDKFTQQESGKGGSKRRARVPLQTSLYGRPGHRVDSYSILAADTSHSHVYISDATSHTEALTMFMDGGGEGVATGPGRASGQVDIWRAREVSEVELLEHGTAEEVVSSLKVYCLPHMLHQPSNGLTMSFHTPTLMNKIFLEASAGGCIDLDGNLMDQLVSVGLLTERGTVRVSHLWAEEVRLATQAGGDIIFRGSVEGNIRAETAGDGDFLARGLVSGARLEVNTDKGDICIRDDLHSDYTQLFTNTGNVFCKRLYRDTKICVKEKGEVTITVMSGTLALVVKEGDILVNIHKISQDSFIDMETGNIVLNVPTGKLPFRISLMSPKTMISPHILNSGEFYVKDGFEYFVGGVEMTVTDLRLQPCLTVRCRAGCIVLQGPATPPAEP